MATTFLEPGGDANFFAVSANGFWGNASSPVPSVATDFVHGTHVKSIKFRGDGIHADALFTPASTLADAGSRISAYFYFTALPSASSGFMVLTDSGNAAIVSMRVDSNGAIILRDGFSGTVLGTSANSVLAISSWKRVAWSYTITSTTVNTFKVWVDGTLVLTVTNATITNTASDHLEIGNFLGDANMDFRSSDHYIDNSAALTDPGDIWVTAKRPNANGTTNGFTTQIGAGGSGYGTGHSPQVNERPLSPTNGWSMVGAGSAVTEEYNIESKSTGDIDISTATIIDYMGWVSASSLASETASIIVNNVTSNISLTSTNTLFTKAAGSATYPASTGKDIGIITSTTLTTVSLYECGILVAFIPVTTVAYTLTAAQASFTLTGEASLFKLAWKIPLVFGSFVLTGKDTVLHYGKTLTAVFGSFVLTGKDTVLRVARTIPLGLGTFALTGENTILRQGIRLVASTGVFTLAGQILRLLYDGSSNVWTNITKSNAPSWTDQNKSAAPTWTDVSKSTTSWTNQNKD